MNRLIAFFCFAISCLAQNLHPWSAVVYYPGQGMTISQIQWNGITHFQHCCFFVANTGAVTVQTPGEETTAVSVAHANGVKALLQVINDDGTQFHDAIANHLALLVSNIITLVNTYGYDGVDVDWEPFDPNTDGTQMTAFAAAMRTALGAKPLTASFITMDYDYVGAHHDSWDQVNIMTYQLGGTWNPYTCFNAAQFDPTNTCISMELTRTRYLAAGLPAAKFGLGIPFFGFQYSAGQLQGDPTQGISLPRQTWDFGHLPTTQNLNYNQIVPLVTAGNYNWDAASHVPWINQIGALPVNYWFITYDDPHSVFEKARYVMDQGLGGWVIAAASWDYISTDSVHPHPLMDAVALAMSGYLPQTKAVGRCSGCRIH